MTSIEPKYVLDSYALVAYFEGESSGILVKEFIEAALTNQTNLYLSLINAGEIFYIVYKEKSEKAAYRILKDIRRLPIMLCDANETRIFAAANYKAKYNISYADGFVASLAMELNAPCVTGDPEFQQLENEISILWLNPLG